MTTHHPRIRIRILLLTLAASAAATVITLGARPAPNATAQTTPGPVNTVVLHMGGSLRFTLNTTFLKSVKAAHAKVLVKDGATIKGRTVTLPIDASTTISTSPGTADILATGTLVVRRADGRKIVSQDITLRLRDSGADVSGTLRGRPQRQFSALTISPTTAVQQIEGGYKFVDIQMLVSNDFASAARRAKIKGFKAGALFGLMNADITADLPTFTLPGVGIGGLLPGS
jgi:hypothetical protein